MHFPRPCPHFSVISNGQFLGLTENYRLYLNTNELAHNCNSYFIHDKTILVYSTLQHQLVFRSLINDQSVTEISSRRTGIKLRFVYHNRPSRFLKSLFCSFDRKDFPMEFVPHLSQ